MSRRIGLLLALFVCVAPAMAQTRVTTNEFVTKVAISDMMEIQSSQLALDRQPDADTKPFAQRMITDHQQTSKELKALVEGGKVKAPLPTGLCFLGRNQPDQRLFRHHRSNSERI